MIKVNNKECVLIVNFKHISHFAQCRPGKDTYDSNVSKKLVKHQSNP